MTFLQGLVLLFIGLKLTHVNDWNWFLIVSPILVEFGLAYLLGAYQHNKLKKEYSGYLTKGK